MRNALRYKSNGTDHEIAPCGASHKSTMVVENRLGKRSNGSDTKHEVQKRVWWMPIDRPTHRMFHSKWLHPTRKRSMWARPLVQHMVRQGHACCAPILKRSKDSSRRQWAHHAGGVANEQDSFARHRPHEATYRNQPAPTRYLNSMR